MSIILEVEPGQDGRSIRDWLSSAHPELDGPVAARVDGRLTGLSAPLPPAAGQLEVLTFADEEGREVYRHSVSHLMAQAVKQLFPQAKLAIGPAIEEGFYYDFDFPQPPSAENLEPVERRMKELVEADLPIERMEMDRQQAIRFFQERDEPYKVELLEEIPDQRISLYRQGEFVDLCRGPHLPSTGRIGAFKLTGLAGAYWRGDERRPMLQRIYGTAFPTAGELEEHLRLREEAERRDHRKLGRELDLFSFNDTVGPGLVLWHPKGAAVRRIIEDFWYREHARRGYQVVYTPHIARQALWQTSGHLSFYQDSMYAPMEIEGEPYYVKPMNCPFHIFIYQSHTRSYRDLPIRLCELGTVYRYERSGTLRGMLRVRGFTQDDAHIFCTPDQATEEAAACLDFALFMMESFGYRDLEVRLSVRQQGKKEYLGTDQDWERAEAALSHALESRSVPYRRDPGEAVFYGPKIDIKLRDAVNNIWQGPTIQFDFNLPARFGVEYIGPDGDPHAPVMIHRALLGSLERFMGGLVEHYAGAFPLWLAPVQVILLPIAERHHHYAAQVLARFAEAGLRAELDDRSESTRFKIREAQLAKIPYMLIVGDREQEAGSVSVRSRDQGDLGAIALEEFVVRAQEEAAS